MKYRERARWGLSEDECRYIYTVCQLFSRQDSAVQKRIKTVLDEVSRPRGLDDGTEEYEREKNLRKGALWACLSTKAEQTAIAGKYNYDLATISRMVRNFYKEYKRRYL